MKKIVSFACLLLSTCAVHAQSWVITGNSNITPSSYLGTSNLKSIVIKTNNVLRAQFDSSGGFRMNTGMRFLNQTDGIVFSSSSSGANTPMMSMFPIYNGPFFLTQSDRMVISHSPYFSNWGLQYQDASDKFNFLSSGANVMTVDLGNKRVGITTNAPAYPLHVTGSGTTAYVTSSYLNPQGTAFKCEVQTPGAFDTRAIWGRNMGTYGYGGYFEGNFIAIDGHVTNSTAGTGYGTSGVAEGGSSNYLYGAYGRANNGYGCYGLYGTAYGGAYNYALYANGNIGGTGTFYYTSDEKFKKNIQPFATALNKIMQLKPSAYEFKVGEFGDMNLPTGKHFGFIAQELQQVFPELVAEQLFPAQYDVQHKKVKEAIKYLGVNYTELIPVMIGAMQQQQKDITEKDAAIESLTAEVNNLKTEMQTIKQMLQGNNAIVSQRSVAASSSLKPAAASLEQNIPNPLNNFTIIPYTLPPHTAQAKLVITDAAGKTAKEVTISGTGKGSIAIDASAFSSGMYRYSLYVEGKWIDTKQMMVKR